jgi:DHA1 family inner membrane transport protein
MKINFPLLALAIGAFGIGTTEFSPMGLLPVIAKGVDVSIPVAGMLISAYAIGVMVGAPLMTLLLSHRARRNALIFLMGIFTVGNLLSSIAPDYTTLLLSRIITSLNHGAFFGLGSVVAASVVFIKPSSRTINREAVRICWIKEVSAIAMRPDQDIVVLYNHLSQDASRG